MENQPIIVKTENLTRVFGTGVEVRALDSVNLSIRKSEFVSIMGPSGSGKSTLLNLLGALDRPTTGKITIDGEDLSQVKDLDHFRARRVGFIFQMHNLLPVLTAVENVEIPMYELPIDKTERRKRAKELLNLVGLGHRIDHLPNSMSGGERQRVAIARSMANTPAILLADEPTGQLDSKTSQEIMTMLDKVREDQGATIIVVTHDPQVARSTERIITLRDGKIQKDEKVASTYLQDLRDFRDSGLGQLLVRNPGSSELNDLAVEEQGRSELWKTTLADLLKKVK